MEKRTKIACYTNFLSLVRRIEVTKKKKVSHENALIQLNWTLEEPEELALCEANSQVA